MVYSKHEGAEHTKGSLNTKETKYTKYTKIY